MRTAVEAERVKRVGAGSPFSDTAATLCGQMGGAIVSDAFEAYHAGEANAEQLAVVEKILEVVTNPGEDEWAIHEMCFLQQSLSKLIDRQLKIAANLSPALEKMGWDLDT